MKIMRLSEQSVLVFKVEMINSFEGKTHLLLYLRMFSLTAVLTPELSFTRPEEINR